MPSELKQLTKSLQACGVDHDTINQLCLEMTGYNVWQAYRLALRPKRLKRLLAELTAWRASLEMRMVCCPECGHLQNYYLYDHERFTGADGIRRICLAQGCLVLADEWLEASLAKGVA